MLKELASYIEGKGVGYTVGANLYAGHRPEDAPVSCAVLLERVPAEEDALVRGHIEAPLQIITRSSTYFGAKDDAEALFELLFGRNRAGFYLPVVDDGPQIYVNIVTGSRPAFIGQDDQNNFEFSTNYIFHLSKEQAT